MAETQTIFEYLKQGGVLALAVILGWILKWSLQRQFGMHEANEKRLQSELETVKAQRDAARDQVLAEKDRASERYHRLANEVAGVTKETGAWFEHLSKLITRRGGSSPPPSASRNKARAEEDEGGAGT